MKYLKEIQTLEALKKELSARKIPEIIIIEGSRELGEFFQVDNELFSDVEILESIKRWGSWGVPIVIDDWEARTIDVEKGEIIYYPTTTDSIDAIRVSKGLAPLHGTPEKPYRTITKSEWLETI